MKKMVAELRYDEDGRKGKLAEMTADKCGGRDVGQHEQQKWSGSK